MKVEQKVKILTSLDELKDTRLSVLGSIHADSLKHILSEPEEYLNRRMDDWHSLTKGKVSQETFNEHYAKRDLKHFLMAPPTTFFFDLAGIIYGNVSDVLDEKTVEKSVTLLINLFPYKMERSEIVALRFALQREYGFTNEFFNIRFLYKDLNEITPDFIKSDVDSFYIYNINDWLLKNNITDIAALKIPEKTVVSSMLLREGFWNVNLDEKVTVDLPELNKSVSIPPDKMVKLATEDYIGLDVIRASYFSLISADALSKLNNK